MFGKCRNESGSWASLPSLTLLKHADTKNLRRWLNAEDVTRMRGWVIFVLETHGPHTKSKRELAASKRTQRKTMNYEPCWNRASKYTSCSIHSESVWYNSFRNKEHSNTLNSFPLTSSVLCAEARS